MPAGLDKWEHRSPDTAELAVGEEELMSSRFVVVGGTRTHSCLVGVFPARKSLLQRTTDKA